MQRPAANYKTKNLIEQQDLPLDKILKSRYSGKKFDQGPSSQSEGKQKSVPKKNKLITKQKQKSDPTNENTKLTSVQIAERLVFNEELSRGQMKQLFKRLSEINSFKYDKFSQKIRQSLVQTIFRTNYPKFTRIIQSYDPSVCSTYLLNSVFHGFQLAWLREKFNSIGYFMDFLKLYSEKIPNCLNKRFAKFMKQTAKKQPDLSIYTALRDRSLQLVEDIMRSKGDRKSNSPLNEKVIGLVVIFQLSNQVRMDQLVKIVPVEKINQYIDKSDLVSKRGTQSTGQRGLSPQEDRLWPQEDRLSPPGQEMSSRADVPPLVHHSVIKLLSQNNLKQVQKIIKSYKIPYTNYPQLVKKLEIKYLEYILRAYPVYFIDELIQGKMTLVQNLVDIYMKRRKYTEAQHFINKYRLDGTDRIDTSKILNSPLIDQDSFGPTQSHVFNQNTTNHFICLRDFDIHKTSVLWIDSRTIYQKPQTTYLKNLLKSQNVSFDSESSTAIHVFQKTRLQLIQIYQPQDNVVFLFDVRDFKNDKKKRQRCNGKKKEPSSLKTQNQSDKNINQQKHGSKGKSSQEPIQVQDQPKNSQNSENMQRNKESHQQQDRTWFRFSKIIQNVFKNANIYGHVIHTELKDIIIELNLKVKQNQIKTRDSQVQFKKYYPQQTKSKLSFLTQKCLGKQISKYEQCSAWDKRPLRKAQKHYAALDAVLPFKLVKWMQQNAPLKQK